MYELALVGVGSANPDHLTRQAIRALGAADLVLIPHKGSEKADLAALRQRLLATLFDTPPPARLFEMPVRRGEDPDYRASVDDWHDAVAARWRESLAAALPEGGRIALMIWGDPSLYDSSLRIAERLRAAGLPLAVTVVPGLTSLQLLTAAHAIPLNDLAAPVLITTGRRLAGGWPEGADRVAVMLDGGCAFQTLDPAGIRIWWGAYLGMVEEIRDAGPLAAAGPRILATRAAARARHGWIMDVYLLARSR
ncbi:MAG: precorrin-6A synthase (deacetylating) [Pseudomonadota bacterium]